MRTLVWFRGKDLRIADHAPLVDAAANGEVVPVFVMSPVYFGRPNALPHRMQFLLDSLSSLKDNLRHLGSDLVLLKGPTRLLIPELVKRWAIDRIVSHRTIEPFGRERDQRLGELLKIPLDLYEGETLSAPGTLRTGSGTPYAVFGPFARACRRELLSTNALPAPKSLPPLPDGIVNESLDVPTLASLGLRKNDQLLPGGEHAARGRLRTFIRNQAIAYHLNRDRMDIEGTSRLSQDLKFGTLSVRTVWQEAHKATKDADPDHRFANELLWREFAYHTMWDRPELLNDCFRPAFQDFPWEDDDNHFRAWAEGQTGYPVVDAAARQLLGEGFVHNRARMISASFLTKHLLTDYRRGEAHYLKFLTDGDWSQNNSGWQWSAGCGCDAQPYFRVFNPMTQGKKFDPDGEYVRKWVPELRELPAKYIHQPWEADEDTLKVAGVELGENYPYPIVDHKEARKRFLFTAEMHRDAYKAKNQSAMPVESVAAQ